MLDESCFGEEVPRKLLLKKYHCHKGDRVPYGQGEFLFILSKYVTAHGDYFSHQILSSRINLQRCVVLPGSKHEKF